MFEGFIVYKTYIDQVSNSLPGENPARQPKRFPSLPENKGLFFSRLVGTRLSTLTAE
jgi:hypothetical protein